MPRPVVIRRRLRGQSDLVWILVAATVLGIVVAQLVGYLRVEFEVYRLANERAMLVAEGHELAAQERQLEIERQVRADQATSLESVAGELNLQPLRPDQVIELEAP